MFYELTARLGKEEIRSWYSVESFARIALQSLDNELAKSGEKASIEIRVVDHAATFGIDHNGELIIVNGYVIDDSDEANRFGKVIAEGLIAFLIDPPQL